MFTELFIPTEERKSFGKKYIGEDGMYDPIYFISTINMKMQLASSYIKMAKEKIKSCQYDDAGMFITVIGGYVYAVCDELNQSVEKIGQEFRPLMYDVNNVITALVTYTERANNAVGYEKLYKILEMADECGRIVISRLNAIQAFVEFKTRPFCGVHEIIHLAMKLNERQREKAGKVNIVLNLPEDRIIFRENGVEYVKALSYVFSKMLENIYDENGFIARKIVQVFVGNLGNIIKIEIANNGIKKIEDMELIRNFIKEKGGEFKIMSNEGVGTIISLELPIPKV